MDPETREVLFGRATKLGQRGWAVGATKVFFLEATAQAIVAEMAEGHTLRVRGGPAGGASYDVDPHGHTFEGKPVYTLVDATRKLPSVRKTPASSRVHAKALALTEVFGTAYYLSESVVDNLMTGDHFFVVGDEPVARLRYDSGFSLGGKPLQWSRGTPKHATLGGKPVFVLIAVGARMLAQKKRAEAGAKPERCARPKTLRGPKSTRPKA